MYNLNAAQVQFQINVLDIKIVTNIPYENMLLLGVLLFHKMEYQYLTNLCRISDSNEKKWQKK